LSPAIPTIFITIDLACGHHLLVVSTSVGAGEEVLSCRECSDDWVKGAFARADRDD
jgi:hypothetical protein